MFERVSTGGLSRFTFLGSLWARRAFDQACRHLWLITSLCLVVHSSASLGRALPTTTSLMSSPAQATLASSSQRHLYVLALLAMFRCYLTSLLSVDNDDALVQSLGGWWLPIQAAYFTFGLVWAMVGLAATIGRHSLFFGAFLDDYNRIYSAAASVRQQLGLNGAMSSSSTAYFHVLCMWLASLTTLNGFSSWARP